MRILGIGWSVLRACDGRGFFELTYFASFNRGNSASWFPMCLSRLSFVALMPSATRVIRECRRVLLGNTVI